MSEFIYKPDHYPGPIAIDMKPSKECDEYHKNSCIQINVPEEKKMYAKFSRNVIFLESFLEKHNIDYKPEDLEETPLGRGYVVRRNSNNKDILKWKIKNRILLLEKN